MNSSIPRRILYVPEAFPLVSETFVLNEIWGLRRYGHEITVAPRIPGDPAAWSHPRAAELRDTLRVVAPSDTSYDIRDLPEALLRSSQRWGGWRPDALRRHLSAAQTTAAHVHRLKAIRCDICVCHFGYDNAVAAAIFGTKTRTPVVQWFHGSDVHTVPHREIAWICNRASAVVTNSRYMADSLQALGAGQVEVSHLGVNLARFSPLPLSDRDPDTLICVARLVPVKNHAFLLQVFHAVKAQRPTAKLVLVGDGPLRAELTAQVEALGLSGSVTFLGARDQGETAHRLSHARLKLLFSHHEALSVALMEAHACGLPAVASRAGGIPEVVADGVTGYLVDLAQPHAVAAASSRIVDLMEKDALYREMSQQAVVHARARFSEELHIERMHSLICQLTS